MLYSVPDFQTYYFSNSDMISNTHIFIYISNTKDVDSIMFYPALLATASQNVGLAILKYWFGLLEMVSRKLVTFMITLNWFVVPICYFFLSRNFVNAINMILSRGSCNM